MLFNARAGGEVQMNRTGLSPKRKRLSVFAAVLASALCLAFPCPAAGTRVMAVSDLHYLAPPLYRDSELFIRALRKGDGKITQYGGELLSALYLEILSVRPDALIVTGDLTFNGEKMSHEALAEWFGSVEDAGVPVWVIPGNHDINTPLPIGYGDGIVYGAEGTTPEDFARIYADFLREGQAGFSYTAEIGGLWVCMTDVAVYRDGAQTFGVFTAANARWLDQALERAAAAGARAVTATHHSLIAHTEFLKDSYLMFGSESMAEIAQRHGVRLNLSGHLHIQHIAREGDLADAALGAFCVWPHRYALVTLEDDGTITYEARELSGETLPEGFSEMSREWFVSIARDKILSSLPEGLGEDAERMAEYAARLNLAYFSGAYRLDDPSWKRDPAYALWEERGDTPLWRYMKQVMDEAAGDNLHYETGTGNGHGEGN